MPWFSSGGSGGGAATVQSDGVTLQGDGSAGNKLAIKAVQLSARLSGAGTVASPLDIAGWPLTGFANIPTGNSASFANIANTVAMMLIALPYPLTFSKFAVQIAVLDAAGTYDWGVYTLAGALIVNLGGIHYPATGVIQTAFVQGAQTLSPGMYWVAGTGTSATMKFEGATNSLALAYANSATASAGGVLPNSATPPSITPTNNNFGFTLQ